MSGKHSTQPIPIRTDQQRADHVADTRKAVAWLAIALILCTLALISVLIWRAIS